MIFTCMKKELVNALQIVSKAVASKPQTPILSGVYLKTEKNILELQATDYDLGFIVRIEAEIEQEGTLVVSGRYLQEVVRKLPGENVSFRFDTKENILHIQSENSKFTLLGMNVSDFPVIPPFEGSLSFDIKDKVLRNLIKKTVFSCSTDENRPIFTGCLLEIDQTVVTMAATNTHRLSVKHENFSEPIGAIKIIIPSKVLNELLHIMDSDVPINVHVTCSHNKISFAFENIYITSRLIEGVFPDYHRVIPKDFSTEVTISKEELHAAVERVSLIAKTGDYNVIRLEFSSGKLHISSNNPEIGYAEETVLAVVNGPDVNIAFNANYIVDVLKNLTGKECMFSLNSSLNPIMVRDGDDTEFTYIVTPVRTNH